jgi:hypothetical protein
VLLLLTGSPGAPPVSTDGTPIGLLLALTRTAEAPPPAPSEPVDGSPIGLLLALTRSSVAPTPQPQPGGGPALGGYARKTRTYEQTKAERDEEKERKRAEFFARIEREAAEEAGLIERAPDAASRSGAGGSPYSLHASTPAQGDGETLEAADGFSQALLARLLASPVDKISRPVQAFPYVISAGRVAAIEAARQRAVQLRDDDEAIAALLMTSLF